MSSLRFAFRKLRPTSAIKRHVEAVTTVILATLLPHDSVIQMLPSGLPVIAAGHASAADSEALAREYSVKSPDVVSLATSFEKTCVNHRFPSGPAVIDPGA